MRQRTLSPGGNARYTIAMAMTLKEQVNDKILYAISTCHQMCSSPEHTKAVRSGLQHLLGKLALHGSDASTIDRELERLQSFALVKKRKTKKGQDQECAAAYQDYIGKPCIEKASQRPAILYGISEGGKMMVEFTDGKAPAKMTTLHPSSVRFFIEVEEAATGDSSQ